VTDEWRGGVVADGVECVLAPNPGPMTLDGTNTWVLQAAAGARSVVVDPGPALDGHLAAVARVAGEVAVVLLTHGHPDHSEGARAFASRAGCPVRAVDPAHRWGSGGLADGDVVEVDGLELGVVGTPGHTADSVSLLVPSLGALLTGDTVLGRGTTVVAHPDGRLDAYLDSLRRLRALVGSAPVGRIWPGHGPVVESPGEVIDGYLAHRAERLAKVREAVAAGATTPRDVVARVYADLEPALWPAAELSVAAQLTYLRTHP
jgi:glyoxylase-like metal-dependent hydrolase (beta-lactamase superfamily II)